MVFRRRPKVSSFKRAVAAPPAPKAKAKTKFKAKASSSAKDMLRAQAAKVIE